MTALTLADEELPQVTPDQVKHFDRDAQQLVLEYHLAGWRSHMTSQGHVFLKAPDGIETATVSRESLRGRSGRNAAAPLKRWHRRLEQEREEREQAARKGAGSSFGIADLEQARSTGETDLPPRAAKAMREHPDVIAYVESNAHRFSGPEAMSQQLYVGVDQDADKPWRMWAVVDTTAGVLVAHGPGYTRNEALTMLRAEGRLPPATEDEIMANSTATTCSECGFTTEKPGALTLHVRIKHTGFVCPECGKNTGPAGRSLATHREAEHGVTPTHRAKVLARKMRANTCTECDQSYTSPQGLAVHRRTQHERDLMGAAVQVARSLERPVTAADVIQALGLGSRSAGTQALLRAANAGLLVRAKRGQYTPAPEPDTPADTPADTQAGDQDVPVTSPDVPPASGHGDVPMTSPTVEGDVERTDREIVEAVRAIVTPPLMAQFAQVAAERDRLTHENEILTKQVADLQARMDLLKEALGA